MGDGSQLDLPVASAVQRLMSACFAAGAWGERGRRVEPLLMLRARSLSSSACGFLGPWRNHERPPSKRSMGASGGYSAPGPGIPPAALQRRAASVGRVVS